MSANINFKDLWAKQRSTAPDPENLLAEIKKIKLSNWRKLVVTNLLLIATSVFIIVIWINFQPQFLSTKIGILVLLFAMLIFLLAYNKNYSLFKSDKDTQTTRDYLKDLLAIKTRQKFMETTMLNLYFVLLSIGIALYLYEYTSRMQLLWGIASYGITFLWILFNWYYLRPKQIKRQNARLDAIIRKFKVLDQQFKEIGSTPTRK